MIRLFQIKNPIFQNWISYFKCRLKFYELNLRQFQISENDSTVSNVELTKFYMIFLEIQKTFLNINLDFLELIRQNILILKHLHWLFLNWNIFIWISSEISFNSTKINLRLHYNLQIWNIVVQTFNFPQLYLIWRNIFRNSILLSLGSLKLSRIEIFSLKFSISLFKRQGQVLSLMTPSSFRFSFQESENS